MYQSSTDGAVPPAKNDPTWMASCRTADNARNMSPAKRLEKYWVEFKEENETEESDGMEVNQTETVSKKSEGTRSSSRRGGRQVISDSSEEEDERKVSSSKKGIVTTPVTHKKNGKAYRRIKTEESGDDDEYRPSSADVTMETEEDSSVVESDSFEVEEDDEVEEVSPKVSATSKVVKSSVLVFADQVCIHHSFTNEY